MSHGGTSNFQGGAIYAWSEAGTVALTISNTEFKSNSAGGEVSDCDGVGASAEGGVDWQRFAGSSFCPDDKAQTAETWSMLSRKHAQLFMSRTVKRSSEYPESDP